MTKKHYFLLAAALKESKPARKGVALTQWLATVASVADALTRDNGAFDRDRFTAACV